MADSSFPPNSPGAKLANPKAKTAAKAMGVSPTKAKMARAPRAQKAVPRRAGK